MHFDLPAAPPASPRTGYWFTMLTRYHWFVLGVAALGWLFDCLDQQLFILARPAAMKELLPAPDYSDLDRQRHGDYATAFFIAGWAFGGILFGILGDKMGRAKTMMLTILLYSLFTGLSALAVGFWDFSLYRFLTGLGVGGEFAVGVALVAEVMPTRARPYTLGLLQALSAVGNISAALINLGLGAAAEQHLITSPWRVMFVIGAVPALLALLIRSRLKEPEQWQKASHDDAVKKQLGSYRELFEDPRWRKHAILGLVLGCSGIIGLWSVGFFTPDLVRSVQRKRIATEVYEEQSAAARAGGNEAESQLWMTLRDRERQGEEIPAALRPRQKEVAPTVEGRIAYWTSYTSIMLNAGAFFGMFGFGALAQRLGRKPTFLIAFLAAFVSTVAVYWYLTDFWQILVLVPIMGFCQLSLFAGYAIYFPELFPTRLRSTGTSFCYNVGRFVTVLALMMNAFLKSQFNSGGNETESLRYAGITMSLVFLVGLAVLPFLPETRGKPLPE